MFSRFLALFENRVFRDEAQHDEPHPDQHEQRHRRAHNHRARAEPPSTPGRRRRSCSRRLAFAAQPRFVPARNAVKPPAPYGTYLPLSASAPRESDRRAPGGRHPVLAERRPPRLSYRIKAGEQVLQRQFAALVRDVVLFDIGQHNAPPILPRRHVVAPPILPAHGSGSFHRVIADIRHILAVNDRHAHCARRHPASAPARAEAAHPARAGR